MSPLGSANPGISNGSIGPPPRLVGGFGPVAPALGQIFVPTVHDTVALRSSAMTDGTGRVSVTFGPTPQNEVWLVERIALQSTSASSTTAKVYLGTIDAGNVVDATTNGDNDIADEVNAILVPSGQVLLVQWSGMSANAQGIARIQYRGGHYQYGEVVGG